MFPVTQSANKQWPKAFELSVSDVGLAMFSKGKPFATITYESLTDWSSSETNKNMSVTMKKDQARVVFGTEDGKQIIEQMMEVLHRERTHQFCITLR